MEPHPASSTATRFSCPSCQRSYRLHVKVLPFYCPCGARLDSIEYTEAKPTLPVVKPYGVGDAMTEVMQSLGIREKVNCSCKALAAKMNEFGIDGCERKKDWIISELKANAEKYSWIETLTIAAQNITNPFAISLVLSGDLYESLFDAAMTKAKEHQRQATADSVKHFAKGRLGVVTPVFNRIGGTETYWQMLHRHIGLVGLVTTHRPQWINAELPIGWGDEAIEALASSADNLIVWGVTNASERTDGPRRIAMHHGSLDSTWANSVFENQLDWCEDAVAINPEVAEHYGVTYIGNAIDVSRVMGVAYPKPKKIALWLHREAQEKRPWLVRKIAAALPDDWMIVASLPANRSTKNLQCVGQVDHPGNWLATADVFLSTADQEGFGYSVAEAMAAGVPVVSSPYGIASDPQLVEQVDGEDPQDWVSAILRAGAKADLARAYISEHHSTNAWAEAWQNLLRI